MPSRRHVLAGAGSTVAAALAGCLGDDSGFAPGTDAGTDWPMPRFDSSNTAYSPDASAPRDSVRERWTVADGSATGPPAVADGTMFASTVGGLVALDATDGAEQWRFEPSRQPWATAPAVHDGLVYATMKDEGALYALDRDTGEAAWSMTDEGRVETAHLVVGEHVSTPVVYAGTENGGLLRLDAATGEVTWRTDLFGTVSAVGHRASQVFVGTRGGEVYAFYDPGDGRAPTEGWRRRVGSAVEALVPTGEGVVVESFGGPLRCLADGAHAGGTRWTADASRANSPPVRAGYTLFVAGYDELAALRDHDADVRWRYRGRFDAAGPVAAGDTLYVSDGDAVRGLALDGGAGAAGVRFGVERWSHAVPGVTGLSVADGAVFAACGTLGEADATLYCLEPAA
jgi:outer membrane protein assembly factor BamB